MNWLVAYLKFSYRFKLEDQCKLFTGAKAGNGYGTITYKGVQLYTHRVSYLANKGDIPEGLSVLHRCDNPACFNPNHLFLGTHADNMKDKKIKGRAKKDFGESSPVSKLTNETVTYIYNLKGKISGKLLARQLNLGATIIYYIWEKRRWTHITDELDKLKLLLN